MSVYSVIDRYTGAVLRSGVCVADMAVAQARGDNELVVAEDAEDSRHYFDLVTLQRLDRPAMNAVISANTITADGVSEVHLIDLPVPCRVTVGKTVYDVLDGRLDISFDTPGRYILMAEAFPYLPAEFEVIAT